MPKHLPPGVLAVVPVDAGDAPQGIVPAFGSLWVETHRGTSLFRIDPADNRIVANIDLGQGSSEPIGVGFGRLWITPTGGATRSIIVDPHTNQVVGSVPTVADQKAFADGSAWVVQNNGTPGAVTRIDPTTLKTIASVTVGSAPEAIVAGADSIWVMNAGDGTVSRIDPSTNRTVATIRAGIVGDNGGGNNYMAYGLGAVWVHGATPSKILFKIDPSTDRVTRFLIPGQTPSQLADVNVAIGDGSLWLRTADGVVSRIDPRTGHVIGHYPADPSSGGGYEAIGYGSLWVTNFATDTVWRDRVVQ